MMQNSFDNGVTPSIAIHPNGTIIEVHCSETFSSLYYRIGRLCETGITWGSSRKYDDGVTPSIAVHPNGTIIEAHCSGNFYSLYYRTGRLSETGITWGNSYKYDNGACPSIAISPNGTIIEVHCTGSSDKLSKLLNTLRHREAWIENGTELFYKVGKLSEAGITWGNSYKYDNKGFNPFVAVSPNGTIIEVHDSLSQSGCYCRNMGMLNNVDDKKIDWDGDVKKPYIEGCTPVIVFIILVVL